MQTVRGPHQRPSRGDCPVLRMCAPKNPNKDHLPPSLPEPWVPPCGALEVALHVDTPHQASSVPWCLTVTSSALPAAVVPWSSEFQPVLLLGARVPCICHLPIPGAGSCNPGSLLAPGAL